MLSIYQAKVLLELSSNCHFGGMGLVMATDMGGKDVIGVGVVGILHVTSEIHTV